MVLMQRVSMESWIEAVNVRVQLGAWLVRRRMSIKGIEARQGLGLGGLLRGGERRPIGTGA